MAAIKKKSKVKNWKYYFLFIRRDAGWGVLPHWKDGKPVRNPFGEPIEDKSKTTCYFHYFVQEDTCPRPIPSFMDALVKSVREPE